MRLPSPSRTGIIATLALLFGLHVALFVLATLVTDSGRDLANAYAIGHGGPYPDYGPGLFGRWKLGPVWFLLLALPLRLFGSVTAAALFTGVLAAAKIPLAFLIGRRLLDVRFGLLAALAISLPGWSSVGTLVIAHTSVVESAMLASFWLALVAWQDRRPVFGALACGMLALALHAHPTALLAAPALVPVLWRDLRQPGARRWLVVGVLLFWLPFVPALLAEIRAGWPQAGASLGYLQESSIGTRLARLPAIGLALLNDGAWFAGRFLMGLPVAAIWLVHGLVMLAALGGALRLARGDARDNVDRARRWLWILLIGSMLAVVFIALLRDATPAWMVYALAPFGTGLLALGGYGLIHDRQHRDAMLAVLSLAVLASSGLLLSQRAGLESAGRIRLPGGNIGDITVPRSAVPGFSPWMSVRQFDALAAQGCDGTGTLTLHGELAAVFDFSQGVASRLACPEGPPLRLGGAVGDRHLAGVPLALARELGMEAQPLAWGEVLRVPLAVHGEAGREADVDVRYRVDRQVEFDAAGDVTLDGELDCATDALLVIANLTPMVNRFTVEAWLGGELLQPRAITPIARYYDCAGATMRWRILTPDPASADVLVISRRAP